MPLFFHELQANATEDRTHASYVPDWLGGLKGSTQHSAGTHLELKTKAKNAR